MPRSLIGYWAKYDIGDPGKATNEDLRKAVEKVGKIANQRLYRLKKAGFEKGMYAHALADLGEGRTRFKESAKRMNRAQLLKEYVALRNFMSAQTSTVAGIRRSNRKRYNEALKRGFVGTEEEFYELVEEYFTKEKEKQFSSNVIYDAIVGNDEKARKTIDELVAQDLTKGEALLAYQESLEKK